MLLRFLKEDPLKKGAGSLRLFKDRPSPATQKSIAAPSRIPSFPDISQKEEQIEKDYLGPTREERSTEVLEWVMQRRKAAQELQRLAQGAFKAKEEESLRDPRKMAADSIRQAVRGIIPTISPVSPHIVPSSERERAAAKTPGAIDAAIVAGLAAHGNVPGLISYGAFRAAGEAMDRLPTVSETKMGIKAIEATKGKVPMAGMGIAGRQVEIPTKVAMDILQGGTKFWLALKAGRFASGKYVQLREAVKKMAPKARVDAVKSFLEPKIKAWRMEQARAGKIGPDPITPEALNDYAERFYGWIMRTKGGLPREVVRKAQINLFKQVAKVALGGQRGSAIVPSPKDLSELRNIFKAFRVSPEIAAQVEAGQMTALPAEALAEVQKRLPHLFEGEAPPKYFEDLSEEKKKLARQEIIDSRKALSARKYPFDAMSIDEKVKVMGPADRFEPYKAAKGDKPEDPTQLLVTDEKGARSIRMASQMTDAETGQPLLPKQLPSKRPFAAWLERPGAPRVEEKAKILPTLPGGKKPGEPPTFENIYSEHKSHVENYLRKLLKGSALSPDLAEDIAQSVFLKLSKETLEDIKSPIGWLITTAKREFWNLLRSKRGRQAKKEISIHKPLLGKEDVTLEGVIPSRGKIPSKAVELKESIDILLSEIDKLKPSQAQIMKMTMNGIVQENIAKELDIPAGTVASAVKRGKAALKTALMAKGVSAGGMFRMFPKKLAEEGVAIIGRDAGIRLEKSLTIKDVYGDEVVLKSGEEFTPYKLSNKQILLQDGEQIVIKKSQLSKVKAAGVTLEEHPAELPDEGLLDFVSELKMELEGSQPGQRIIGRDETTDELIYGGKGLFPEFWKKGWTKKSVLNIITKGMAGKKLTSGQQGIYDDILEEAQARYKVEPEKYRIAEEREPEVLNLDKRLGFIEEAAEPEVYESWAEYEKLLEADEFGKAEKRIQQLEKKDKVREEKQIQFNLADKESAQNLIKTFEKQKDIWIGETDVRILRSKLERKRLQGEIRETLGKRKYDKVAQDMDAAIKLYIDTKRNPEHVSKYYDKLTDEQKRIVDLSQNLPAGIKIIANKISASFDKIGAEAKDKDVEVIKNTIENYVARIWKMPDEKIRGITGLFRKFGTTTKHAKARKLETIIEGWAKGYDLKVKGATNSLQILKEEIVKTIEDKKFLTALRKMRDIDGNELLTTQHLDGYIKVEHTNFKAWEWAGKAEEGKVYGKNFFRTEDGELFERRELYAPEPIAKNLNKILGISKLKGIPAIDFATKYTALMKSIILQTSLFHYFAFARSYYLGTNKKTMAEMSIGRARNEGLRLIEEEDPGIILGVRHGLTLGLAQDWDEEILAQESLLDKQLNKFKPTKEVKDFIVKLRRDQAEFLFNRVGAPLKAKAFMIEMRNILREHPDIDMDEAAKAIAELVNNDFGGLHLQRLGRDPTVQHIFKLFALAADWTESNVRTVIDMFRRAGKDKKAHAAIRKKISRRFWAGVLWKGSMATIMANMLMATIDEDDEETKNTIDRFLRNYKRMWDEGHYRWLDVDITPIYKMTGGETERRKYFSILGHFKDPLKFLLRNPSGHEVRRVGGGRFRPGNVRALKHKASVIGRNVLDFFTGTDWAGRRFTTWRELIGKDVEKGVYKTTQRGKYKKGDPKWGKFKGKAVTWDWGGKGTVEFEQIPSYAIAQTRGNLPVQVQNFLAWATGEMEGFDAIANALGIGVRTTYERKKKEKKPAKKLRLLQ